ncbi:hypothetical protein WISP_87207 [Willisornis vidua]|uniref:Uncharacterized protein n=1 Tax=Willisornis vidua TaxID=1566151 RepID=A0ABQ9D8J6_9PASS|nr:hypothetical protein WISP_87207 [Willisornis vidua]
MLSRDLSKCFLGKDASNKLICGMNLVSSSSNASSLLLKTDEMLQHKDKLKAVENVIFMSCPLALFNVCNIKKRTVTSFFFQEVDDLRQGFLDEILGLNLDLLLGLLTLQWRDRNMKCRKTQMLTQQAVPRALIIQAVKQNVTFHFQAVPRIAYIVKAFSASHSTPPARRLGVCKELGADLNRPKGNPTPYDVMLSLQSWKKEEGSDAQSDGVCFPKSTLLMVDPCFPGDAWPWEVVNEFFALPIKLSLSQSTSGLNSIILILSPIPRGGMFLAKLLKRLYGETSSSSVVHTSNREEEAVFGNLGTKSEEKNLHNVQNSSTDASTSTDPPCESFQGSDDAIMSPRRMYTVDLPPEGYVAVTPDAVSNAVSEDSVSSADSTAVLQASCRHSDAALMMNTSSHVSFESTEEEYQGQTKRKRVRRKKQKTNLQISNNLHGEQTNSEMQETLVQDNIQLQQRDSPKISKNKKRKMKKKRQKEKKRAAGLITKTTSVDFTYQPDKHNREEAEGLKDIDEKADSILDFLQATQQIYFADSMYHSFSSLFMSIMAQKKMDVRLLLL